jgi:hypothetical protein
MEITCSRCHQTLQDGACYCPACGLPQLVYTNDETAGPGQSEPRIGAARDAASVNWRAALRSSLLLAVPAGLLCSLLSPVSVLGLFWMAAAAAWTVMLYVRSQQTAWITIGAGARIGLVTGVLGGWTAACASGVTLFALRFVFHNGSVFDDFWQNLVGQQMSQQWSAMGVDAKTIAMARAWLLSPEGRAGWVLCAIVLLAFALLLFAIAGGALSARMISRRRKTNL